MRVKGGTKGSGDSVPKSAVEAHAVDFGSVFQNSLLGFSGGCWNGVPKPASRALNRILERRPKSALGPQRQILARRSKNRFWDPKVAFGTAFQNSPSRP